MKRFRRIMEHLFRTAEMPEKYVTAPTPESVAVFASTFVLGESGRAALYRILKDNSFFDRLETEEDVIQHNSMTQLLYSMGIWVPANYERIVNALCNIAPIAIDTEGRE